MSDNPMVLLETSEGDILVELFADKAPKTVDNFLGYVDSGHYSGTIFHRVIKNFMVQGGGFDLRMNQKETGAPIENEASPELKNEKYTLAMARTMDPHSASAQFFINAGTNPHLDHTAPTEEGYGYAVFGKVVEGQDVVDKIQKVKTRTFGPHGDVPVDPISIVGAERFEA